MDSKLINVDTNSNQNPEVDTRIIVGTHNMPSWLNFWMGFTVLPLIIGIILIATNPPKFSANDNAIQISGPCLLSFGILCFIFAFVITYRKRKNTRTNGRHFPSAPPHDQSSDFQVSHSGDRVDHQFGSDLNDLSSYSHIADQPPSYYSVMQQKLA